VSLNRGGVHGGVREFNAEEARGRKGSFSTGHQVMNGVKVAINLVKNDRNKVRGSQLREYVAF
jgi:hypothetical protein